MVDIRKELPYVAFQNPARPRIVFPDGAGERTESIKRLMRPLALTARIRIDNKPPIEERI